MNNDEIESLRQQVFSLLVHDPNELESARTARLDTKAIADAYVFPSLKADEPFSEFLSEHIETALEIATSYAQLVTDSASLDDADAPGLTGVKAAIERHRGGLAEGVDPALLDHALMLFMTHNPDARRYLHGTTPPLIARQLRELPAWHGGASVEADAAYSFYGRSDSPEEDQLAWFRSDPLCCEHHFHWHVVYPTSRSAPNARQGELFVYMHTQMLARYDAERLALKLDPVEGYHDYEQELPVAYDPGNFVQGLGYGAREPRAMPRDVRIPRPGRPPREILVERMQQAKREWDAAIEGNHFSEDGREDPITPDLLGCTIESSAGRFGTPEGPYYNHHNNGHVMIAAVHEGQPWGVMRATQTATRDPIFWMWHKYIDMQSERWQDRQTPNDFSDGPPVDVGVPLVVRHALLADIEDIDAFAELAAAGNVSSSLSTRMRRATIEYQRRSLDYEHLEHDRFSYLLPVHNKADQACKVTLRIWIAPKDRVEHRRAWIEMDKLVVELAAGERRWVRREDLHASVIRKPAVLKPGEYNRDYRPESTMPARVDPNESDRANLRTNLEVNKRAHEYLVRADKDTEQLRQLRARASALVDFGQIDEARQALTDYYEALLPPSQIRAFCECGWPYHLLTPRGSAEGMRFVVMVMATDWELDKVSNESCCGSMSFCGANELYPDKREMGYPFNRGFPGGLIQTLERLDNVGMSELVITFEGNSEADSLRPGSAS